MAIIEALPPPELPSCVVGEEWRGRAVVITVAGDLDLLTAPDLEACIEVALRKQPTALIVDLSSVDFLASRGMEVLLGARDSAPGRGRVRGSRRPRYQSAAQNHRHP